MLNDLLKPGTVTVLSIEHDDGCPTIKSQNANDCTCREVNVKLVPLDKYEPFMNSAQRRAAKK